MEIVITIVVILAVCVAKGIYDHYRDEKQNIFAVRQQFGNQPKREYQYEKLVSLGEYARKHASGHGIDDITWHDLDMDCVFAELNSTHSCFGEEYLYYLLREPSMDSAELAERERVIKLFADDEHLREEISLKLRNIGRLRTVSMYEYLNRLADVDRESNVRHILQALLLIASIGVIFVNPPVGILAASGMFFCNIITYFKRKKDIEHYYMVLACLLRLIDSARELSKLGDERISAYTAEMAEASKAFDKMRRGASIVVPTNASGDLFQSLYDYLRMAFHIDLIKFNSMLDIFIENRAALESLFRTIGFIDAMCAISSYRAYKSVNCVPELRAADERSRVAIDAQELYHPLLDEPVKNSIHTERSVLITGSNASGKSTFIKTIAINAILAQSVHTVLADSYSGSYVRVMSSMALSDDLAGGESYYIVETKSLKRILDAVSGDIPVLCFIDEVLRGTNTLERIAASTQILKSLASDSERALCFAATHDIELTQILEKIYDNYHFEEHIQDGDVLFDYKLREGRSSTRNAIKLLGLLGYPDEIIARAEGMAQDYLNRNEWEIIDQ